VKALFLQAPFTSLADVGQFHYPIFPIRWLMKDTFAVVEKAKRIRVPVLILHGSADTIIPPALSRKLLEAFSGPKQAEYIPNRGYNDLYEPSLVMQFVNTLRA